MVKYLVPYPSTIPDLCESCWTLNTTEVEGRYDFTKEGAHSGRVFFFFFLLTKLVRGIRNVETCRSLVDSHCYAIFLT